MCLLSGLCFKTALHCALHNEFQKTQTSCCCQLLGAHSPNETCKYLSLTLRATVCLAPEENSALCQLGQKDKNYNKNAIMVIAKNPAFMMSVVLIALGIICRIIPVPFWPAYFLVLD